MGVLGRAVEETQEKGEEGTHACGEWLVEMSSSCCLPLTKDAKALAYGVVL